MITPAPELRALFSELRKLGWQRPEVVPPADVRNPSCLLLPSPLAARDGAHAALVAAERLNLHSSLVVGLYRESRGASDMIGSSARVKFPGMKSRRSVHPALFESWPRLHLHALALGIPVIATEACGLEEGGGVTLVPFNDEDALVRQWSAPLVAQVENRTRTACAEEQPRQNLGALDNRRRRFRRRSFCALPRSRARV